MFLFQVLLSGAAEIISMEAVLAWLQSKEMIVEQVGWMKDLLAGVASIMDSAASPESKLGALRAVQVEKPEEMIGLAEDAWKEMQEALAEQGVREQIGVIHAGLTRQILPLCDKVLAEIKPLLAVEPFLQDVTDSAGYYNGLQLLQVVDLESTINKLVPQARDISDDVLKEQLTFLQVAFKLQQATANLAMHMSKNSDSREQARINETAASLLSEVRTRHSLLRQHGGFLEQSGTKDVFAASETTNHIVRAFDGLVEHPVFMAKALEAAELLIGIAQHQYVMDAEQLADVVIGWCPAGWEMFGRTLMQEAEIKKALLTNAHYQQVGPGIDLLQAMRGCFKQVAKDGQGPMSSPAAFRKVKFAIEHGSMTVATTFALYHLERVIPQLDNATAQAKAAADLRKKCVAKIHGSSTLPESVEKAITSFTG